MRAARIDFDRTNYKTPGLPLSAVARAMINAVRLGAPKAVLEAKDIKEFVIALEPELRRLRVFRRPCGVSAAH